MQKASVVEAAGELINNCLSRGISGTRRDDAKGDVAIFYGTVWHCEASWKRYGPEWYGQGPACREADKRRLWIGAWTLGLGVQK
jgi:hypothetical protein